MAITVNDIQSRVAGMVDQNEDITNIDTADYSLRLNYINRRERAWSEVGKFDVLYKEYHTLTSTDSANCSISLPDDYRKLASFPRITYDGVTSSEFPEIKPTKEGQYNKSSDLYVKVLGNDNTGRIMVVNPATTSGYLASGASISIPYYSIPTSLASPADQITCPNPEYLVQGVVADVWESREDARYQAKQVEANVILQNMIEQEFTPSEASSDDTVKTVEQSKYGFRIGE